GSARCDPRTPHRRAGRPGAHGEASRRPPRGRYRRPGARDRAGRVGGSTRSCRPMSPPKIVSIRIVSYALETDPTVRSPVMRQRRTPVGRKLAMTAKVVGSGFNAALAATGGTLPTWLILAALQ